MLKNRFIIVVPCTQVLATNDLGRLSMLLLLAGDIELNPGRKLGNEKMLRELMKGQNTIAEEIHQIKVNHTVFSKQLDEINHKISQTQSCKM